MDTAPTFLQYGALGLLALLCTVAVRVLFTQVSAHAARETVRADRNEADLKELNKAVRDQVIPAALEMVTTTRALIELLAHERAQRGP